ncbi:MAG: helix-turn-helix domain-containing protein [Methylobacter sp.]
MKTLTEYLDLIKSKKGFEKDRQLAEFLGITKASLSIMKSGGGASQETAERIAEGAGVALEEVWLASLIQKEQNPKFKHVLENISRMSGIAASVAIACILTNFQIEEAGLYANNHFDNLYIMRSHCSAGDLS